jgi:hypothetical protein
LAGKVRDSVKEREIQGRTWRGGGRKGRNPGRRGGKVVGGGGGGKGKGIAIEIRNLIEQW